MGKVSLWKQGQRQQRVEGKKDACNLGEMGSVWLGWGGGGVSDCVGVWLSSGPFASHSMNSKHLCQTLVQFL